MDGQASTRNVNVFSIPKSNKIPNSEDPTTPLTVQEATRLIATRPDALNTVS